LEREAFEPAVCEGGIREWFLPYLQDRRPTPGQRKGELQREFFAIFLGSLLGGWLLGMIVVTASAFFDPILRIVTAIFERRKQAAVRLV
jgi:hypothetical protein